MESIKEKIKCPNCNIEFERNIFNIHQLNFLINQKQKKGMADSALKGNHVSKAPFGYKFSEGKLIPAENYLEIEEIFEKFLEKESTLRSIAKRHDFSVNGMKKILSNFTYIGKVKFDGEIHQGIHKSIISAILFNRVQDKLEKLKRNKRVKEI